MTLGQVCVDQDVDFAQIAAASEGFSGADLKLLCKEAAMSLAACDPFFPSQENLIFIELMKFLQNGPPRIPEILAKCADFR